MKLKYGMLIRLRHDATSQWLKSHDKRFPMPPSLSGAQMVVATNDNSETSTVWRIKGKDGTASSAYKNQLVKNGDIIRLEHLNTQTNLHSHPLEHGHYAPLTRDTNHQEVVTAGAAGECDTNDNWIVETSAGGDWVEGENVRLCHEATTRPLHSHNSPRNRPETDGYQEVTAYVSRDANDFWKAICLAEAPAPTATKISDRNRVNLVKRLLDSFSDCAGYVLLRRGKPIFSLEKEAGVQDLIFLNLKPSIPDLRPENPVGGKLRHYSIQDFRSARLKIVVEAKIVRSKEHGKTLKEELDHDIGEYKNDPYCKDLFFFIYDPKKYLEDPSALAKSIRGAHMHGKRRIQVHCIIA